MPPSLRGDAMIWYAEDPDGEDEEVYLLESDQVDLVGPLWQAVVVQVVGLLDLARQRAPHAVIAMIIRDLVVGPDVLRWLEDTK